MKLSIVLSPFYEAQTLHLILDNFINDNLMGNFIKEINIVNDYSKNNTIEIVNQYMLEYPKAKAKSLLQPIITLKKSKR